MKNTGSKVKDRLLVAGYWLRVLEIGVFVLVIQEFADWQAPPQAEIGEICIIVLIFMQTTAEKSDWVLEAYAWAGTLLLSSHLLVKELFEGFPYFGGRDPKQIHFPGSLSDSWALQICISNAYLQKKIQQASFKEMHKTNPRTVYYQCLL
jgi:hypothetical protein